LHKEKNLSLVEEKCNDETAEYYIYMLLLLLLLLLSLSLSLSLSNTETLSDLSLLKIQNTVVQCVRIKK